jgi:hypothetical protein
LVAVAKAAETGAAAAVAVAAGTVAAAAGTVAVAKVVADMAAATEAVVVRAEVTRAVVVMMEVVAQTVAAGMGVEEAVTGEVVAGAMKEVCPVAVGEGNVVVAASSEGPEETVGSIDTRIYVSHLRRLHRLSVFEPRHHTTTKPADAVRYQTSPPCTRLCSIPPEKRCPT